MDKEKEVKIENLKHSIKHLPGGQMVLVLDTGAQIPPEAVAMLQALFSRSPKSVVDHLKVVLERGWKKFMSQWYVGYSHKSIGDCATATIFIESVSMLAAKAIQDNPLYSGQEVSTRYVDFANQSFIDPMDLPESKSIQEDLRTFYLTSLDPLCEDLKKRFPMQAGEKEAIYNKAIRARAFDILRGFLPAGASTSLAWHTNLRQAADHLMMLRYHALEEVREVSATIEAALQDAFPSSFGHKRYEETENYNQSIMSYNYYLNPRKACDFAVTHCLLDQEMIAENIHIFKSRPPKAELPKFIAECGTMQFSFLLDFGSYRDLQRHRAVTQRMPFLAIKHGFEKWYLDELPEDLRQKAEDLLENIETRMQELPFSNLRQYYVPMGYRVACRVTGNLPALIYLAELRTSSTVHPTLRKRAQQMAEKIRNCLRDFDIDIPIYTDDEPTRFDTRRGHQDITEKT